MKKVSVVEGRAAPLERSDVDTDQIIPAQWLKRVERTGFGRGLFSEWRDDPSFVLNDAAYQGATILLGAANFGTGSSREHAVWALLDYGFEVVVASSFGDIFRNNSAKQGLVTAELPAELLADLTQIVKSDPSAHLIVDVDRRIIEVPAHGVRFPFGLADATRERLLSGEDDIDVTLRHLTEIDVAEVDRDRLAPPAASLFDPEGRLVDSAG
jgi:3-isopropylmalate/(R)-2-methylmalate dehydratase small subunit